MNKELQVGKLILISIALFFIIIAFWFLYDFGKFSVWGAHHFQILDYSCTDGTLILTMRNGGTEPINFGTSCIVNSSIVTCGDITVIKTTGTFSAAPTISPTSIATDKTATFSEFCGINNTCNYRFLFTNYKPAEQSVYIATVICS